MIGSSMLSGSLPRARATLSRTSAAAESGSRLRVKRTLILLTSERLCEVMTSTPSMPASESSSGFVTCDSTTSAEAPRYVVCTLTTGSSMRGYSRTDRRVYEISPTRTMVSDSTVASTGRLTQISGNTMAAVRTSRSGLRCGRRRGRVDLGRYAHSGRRRRGTRWRGGADHLHRNAFAQLELARRDDHVVVLQALDDFSLAVATLADL